jgi:hypothetical protein
MASPLLRLARNLLLAIVIAGAGTWGVAAVWRSIGGGDLSVHGWIALSLGIAGTVGLAWALMSLAFKSDREGWDDRVDNTFDPSRNPDDEP